MAYKQYPKPLAEKSLQKKYAELNLSEEKIAFLKKFILACTNLYGFITVRDAWEVYKELSEKADVPKVKRIDLIRISGVLRREELPYFVFEIDELYDEETRADLDREFVSRYLIGNGYGKLTDYYRLAESQSYHDIYFVPEALLSFAERPVSLQEQSLLAFLGKLKVTEDEYENRWGKIKACSGHKGETLDSFSFMNEDESFSYRYANGEIKGAKGNPKEAQRILEENNRLTEAQKIVDSLRWQGNLGDVSPNKMIQYTADELNEVGVLLSKMQLEKLLNKIMDFHNNSHLMCLKGWSPNDLAQYLGGKTLL